MQYQIKRVITKKELQQFLKLPWKIYKNDRCWVPPLLKDFKSSLNPAENPALKKIIHDKFLLYKDGKPAGRIYTGIDTNLNGKKNMKMAFFSLFECIDDYEAAKLLFDSATEWAKKDYSVFICGPV